MRSIPYLFYLAVLSVMLSLFAPVVTQAQVKQPVQRAPYTAVLSSGESLVQGQYLVSANGRYSLFMQTDGNLVLYKLDGSILWQTNTGGHTEYFRIWMSPNGSLALLDRNNLIITTTPTNTYPGAFLQLLDTGNLVIYDGTTIIWSTNTAES
ncbi:hypothetical protein KTO58_02900 [Chitinophaga pendula]|uniref:hypothetical protein n=1 Tax=Chitinophaga TaxID=79328 RepID=UPI000BAF56E6|nr:MULTISPECIES: hypothetical protein [Chitinophaga]ASZ14214.1 hypothetical protein CK934_26320 [Chitinophaga sp. MD30]UCJ08146.1 hypothetical protein KTO58_02900 [Chitinophaga pendula]